MTVYIPSYFNNLVEREILFKESIDSYLKLNFKIIVIWMNDNFDKIENNNILYIDSIPKNASIARNQLLEIFYNSNENYCYLSDDDTQLLKDINTNKDCISIVNDKRQSLINTHKLSTSLLKLKNLNKFYDKRLYFDEYLEANQDYDFGISLIKNKCTTEIINTKNVIINKGISSMFNSPQNRMYKKLLTLHYIKNKHNDFKDI